MSGKGLRLRQVAASRAAPNYLLYQGIFLARPLEIRRQRLI
jgi:hypothetical protein